MHVADRAHVIIGIESPNEVDARFRASVKMDGKSIRSASHYQGGDFPPHQGAADLSPDRRRGIGHEAGAGERDVCQTVIAGAVANIEKHWLISLKTLSLPPPRLFDAYEADDRQDDGVVQTPGERHAA